MKKIITEKELEKVVGGGLSKALLGGVGNVGRFAAAVGGGILGGIALKNANFAAGEYMGNNNWSNLNGDVGPEGTDPEKDGFWGSKVELAKYGAVKTNDFLSKGSNFHSELVYSELFGICLGSVISYEIANRLFSNMGM